MMYSANSSAASGIDGSSHASRRSVGDERAERGDDPQRVAVRLHQQRARVLGEQRVETPDVPGRLQHPPRRSGGATGGAGGRARCQRYAELMSASCSSHVPYDGTWYCVGKIMLRKSEPVMRTHSCGRRAPIGCIARKPGRHEVDHRERLVDLGDARIGVVRRGLGRRERLVDLPRQRHAVAGSCASRSCRIVVPVRPWPTITIGGTTSAAVTSGARLRRGDDVQAVARGTRSAHRERRPGRCR